MKAIKFFLVFIAVFFGSSSRRTNIDIPSCPLAFLFQRGCGSLAASTDETYFHADRHFKIPRSTDERYHADVWGNRLPFPPKAKKNLSGFDISQPTPSTSLSVPSFSLDMTRFYNFFTEGQACSCPNTICYWLTKQYINNPINTPISWNNRSYRLPEPLKMQIWKRCWNTPSRGLHNKRTGPFIRARLIFIWARINGSRLVGD